MFNTFLNKTEWHFLDLSALLSFNPEQILFYYYNSYLKIPLTVYVELTQLAKKERDLQAPLFSWLELFEDHLQVTADILGLSESKFYIPSALITTPVQTAVSISPKPHHLRK